jgi:hypothetical protein
MKEFKFKYEVVVDGVRTVERTTAVRAVDETHAKLKLKDWISKNLLSLTILEREVVKS